MDNLPSYDALRLPGDRELRLRPWRPEDAEAVYAACSDARTAQWVFRDYTPDQAVAYVETAPEAWAARRHLRLCLTDDSDTVLGSADLDDLHTWHRSSDLGWWIAPGHRGRGLGVRMGRLLVRTGFEVLGLHRLTATLAGGNSASRWVAAGAGLRLESAATDGWLDGDGVWWPRETWRLLATETPLSAQPELTAGALHLRPWRPGDEPALVAACSDPDIARYTHVPVPYTDDVARDWVRRASLTAWATGEGAHFAVLDSVTAALLAGVGVTARASGVWEIGWWVAPEARGRGVATTAAGAVLRWLRATTPVEVVEWRAVAGNEGSRNVASRLGFTFEGTQRARFAKDRRREDEEVGSLLRAEIR